jgi:hypothetical protein
MNSLENISFEKLSKIYSKYFTLGYLNTNLSDKLACIALTCYITNEVKKKNKNLTCYDVLLKVAKDSGEIEKKTFLKSLAAICEDYMYGYSISRFWSFSERNAQATQNLIRQILSILIDF